MTSRTIPNANPTVIASVVLLLSIATVVSGQGISASKPNAPTTAPRAATQRAAKPTPEELDKYEILRSPEWAQMIHDFNSWLSTQSLYDPQQVKQLQAKLDAKVRSASAAQLRGILGDMQEKLIVLTSPQAREAETYLEETLSVASPAYAARVRQRLPDVASLTANQIQSQLAVYAQRRSQVQQGQKAFNAARQEEIRFNQSVAAAQRSQQQRAADRAAAALNSPGSTSRFTPARDYYPDVGDDTAYYVPFFSGFGPGIGGVFVGGGRR